MNEILAYILSLIIFICIGISFIRIPMRYFKYINRKWKIYKIDKQMIKMYDYSFSLGLYKYQVIEICQEFGLTLNQNSFKNVSEFTKVYNRVYNYIYENYDPKSRDDKIDEILKN